MTTTRQRREEKRREEVAAVQFIRQYEIVQRDNPADLE
jgi:hypothetical protein